MYMHIQVNPFLPWTKGRSRRIAFPFAYFWKIALIILLLHSTYRCLYRNEGTMGYKQLKLRREYNIRKDERLITFMSSSGYVCTSLEGKNKWKRSLKIIYHEMKSTQPAILSLCIMLFKIGKLHTCIYVYIYRYIYSYQRDKWRSWEKIFLSLLLGHTHCSGIKDFEIRLSSFCGK